MTCKQKRLKVTTKSNLSYYADYYTEPSSTGISNKVFVCAIVVVYVKIALHFCCLELRLITYQSMAL